MIQSDFTNTIIQKNFNYKQSPLLVIICHDEYGESQSKQQDFMIHSQISYWK